MPVNIVLIDDHALVRDGIKSLLEDAAGSEVIGEASNGKEGVELVESLRPDLAIFDIRMPEMTGIEAVQLLQSRGNKTPCLMLSMHDSEEYVLQSLKAGARGYLMKDASREEFLKAIQTILEGERYFSGDLSDILVRQILDAPPTPAPAAAPSATTAPATAPRIRISKRQQQILNEVIQGASNQEIADLLGLSRRTIETHRYKLMEKLGVSNKRELIQKAREMGLV